MAPDAPPHRSPTAHVLETRTNSTSLAHLFDEMNARCARSDAPITVDGGVTRGGGACVLRRTLRRHGWRRAERPGMARACPTRHTRTSAANRSSIPHSGS